MATFARFMYLTAIASTAVSNVGLVAARTIKRSPCQANKESEYTLSPILNPQANTASLKNLVPSKDVSLNWGSETSGMVNVSLEMNNPTVLLEEIDDITKVDCESSSVLVTFSNAAAFDEAVADWSDNGDFILVTNHLGDCDAENERGIFLTKSITTDKDTFTIIANGEKTDVNSAATYTEITFSGIPVSSSSKRAITLNPDGLTLSHSLSLPHDTTLYSYPPYFSVIADNADLSTSVTFSGKLRYSILLAKLYELSFDIDTSASADLGLTLDVTAAYSTTFSYDAPALTYSIVNVPGIVSLGPALAFAIGANLDANAAVQVTTDLGARISNGNFHLDFLDSSKSSATGWAPTFNAAANISEKAVVSFDPYVDITVELQFLLLGGLVDLSGGLTAQPKFNNDFTLSASQHLEGETEPGSYTNGTITQPNDAACAQGLAIKSDFEFSIIAFATQWWQQTLYHVTVPIVDKCYSWL